MKRGTWGKSPKEALLASPLLLGLVKLPLGLLRSLLGRFHLPLNSLLVHDRKARRGGQRMILASHGGCRHGGGVGSMDMLLDPKRRRSQALKHCLGVGSWSLDPNAFCSSRQTQHRFGF